MGSYYSSESRLELTAQGSLGTHAAVFGGELTLSGSKLVHARELALARHVRVLGRVGAQEFRELVAWQLADQLRQEVLAVTATGTTAKDFRYCNQMRDSSSSIPRNIAEGFGRYRPREFARFCEFALGSLNETQDGLIDGRNRGYLDGPLFSRLWNLSKVTERAIRNLMFYLRSKAPKAPGRNAS